MGEAHHSIRAVAQRTGLSAHVIRIWEKRYGAVGPERTATNRRLYSEEHIQRLGLLRDLTRGGHSIGQVAALPTAKLRQLVSETVLPAQPMDGATNLSALDYVSGSLAVIKNFDERGLNGILKRAEVQFGRQGFLQQVLGPLLEKLGDQWREGFISAAHEHFAQAIIRGLLGAGAHPFAGTQGAPVLIVATPAGQLHELGALLAAAAAVNLGWHVTYLGASLPAAEIAGAALQSGARAVALSLVYPEDDPLLEGEMIRLREALPEDMPILIGGRAMPAYQEAAKKVGAVLLQNLDDFCERLDALRKLGPGRRVGSPR